MGRHMPQYIYIYMWGGDYFNNITFTDANNCIDAIFTNTFINEMHHGL